MATSIHPRRTSHFNVVLENYDASLAHLQKLFGAVFLLDLPNAEWHACLVDIGGVIFELFAPTNFLLNSRHGPHYLGIEYEAEMDEVRAALVDHKVRVIRELGVAVHCNPLDCFGVDFEFYQGSFFDNTPPILTTPVQPAAYWRDEHPLGLTGLKAYTMAVSDIDAASRFLQGFMAAEPRYESARPEIAARAVGLQVADAVIELLTPTGNGSLQREMQQLGQGIRSTVFGVRSIDQAKRYFAEHGVKLHPGTAPGSVSIASADNLGVMFEFAE